MQHQPPLPSLSVPWKAADVGAALVVVVTVWVGALLLLWAFAGTAALGPSVLLFTFIVEGVLLFAAWWFGPRRTRSSLRLLGFRAPAVRRHILLPLGVVVSSLVLGSAYIALVNALGLDTLVPPAFPEEIREGGVEVPGFLLTVFWGPLAEETFFRGFLFPPLLSRLGLVGATGATSLLFALSHGAVGLLIPVFLMGVLLALLYRHTRSIWSCWMAHALQNAIAFTVGV